MTTPRQEIYQDIQHNCDAILFLLRNHPADNDTPEGRMVFQCRWLKQQSAAGVLPLPVTEFRSTLEHVYSERYLEHLASDPAQYRKEIEIHLYRLLNLIDGQLIVKPTYYPFIIRQMSRLTRMLKEATRPLTTAEVGLTGELAILGKLLQAREIEPPLIQYLPDYPNFRRVYSRSGSSTDDLGGGQFLTREVALLLFEGIRPKTWESPELADRETN